ncbi:fibrinogen-related protein 3-2, partial [Elysia marginata]
QNETTGQPAVPVAGGQNQTYDEIFVSNTSELLACIQQMVSQALGGMENRLGEKISQLAEDLANKIDYFENKMEDKISVLQEDFINETVSLENKMEELNMTVKNEAAALQETFQDPRLGTCYRKMRNDVTPTYPQYVKLMDDVINRKILCDTKTDGGGWIVIQKRTKGDVEFSRTWSEYKEGFGVPPGDFWLGNDAIHALTSNDEYELRVDFWAQGQNWFAHYSSFKIEDEAAGYRLRLGSQTGGLLENSNYGLSHSNGRKFTTKDTVNACTTRNCGYSYYNNCRSTRKCTYPYKYAGGWWYRNGAYVHINSKWGTLRWSTGWGDTINVDSVEMKIRQVF